MTFYGEDLAFIHDAGWSEMAIQAADRLIEELGRPDGKGGLVVELGCGSGASASRLLAAGYDVTGVDRSPDMIARATERAPRGSFLVGSWTDFEIPPCDAVLAANEVLNYVEPGVTAKTLERLFARVYKALWPGGLFVFDMAGPGRIPGGGPETSTRVGDDWAVIATSTEDRRGMLRREITSFRKVGSGIRIAEELHTQRLFASSKVLEMLRKAGFKARSAQGYGGERAFPGHSVFIARRP